jgi:hypothetical protein
MLLDTHRLGRAIELSALDRVASAAERRQREQDVALLVRAAYTDASEVARADFMAAVGKQPEWPWSAVRASAPRPGDVRAPGVDAAPAVLLLLRGQVESADVDPGIRIPDRGTAEAAAWEPLYRALDAWDTATIVKWIGPQGWVVAGGRPPATEPSRELPVQSTGSSAIPWTHPAMITAGAVAVVAAGTLIYAWRQERRRRQLEDAIASQEAL